MKSNQFVPVADLPCFGQLPCLHTTAQERLQKGCHRMIWNGTWQDTSVALYRNLSLGGAKYPTNTLGISNRFIPAVAYECDVSDLLFLSPSEAINLHRNDAIERHLLQRLHGLHSKLWLMIGSSVDHMNMNLGCPLLFGSQKTTAISVERGFGSDHLTMDICHSPVFNFSFAYVFVDGFSTTIASRNATLRAAQFEAIHHQLVAWGWSVGPEFVTMSGLEWDFKHWMDASATPDFENVRPAILMQLGLLQRLWPDVTGVFLRTHFATLHSRYGRPYLADASKVARYNDILRSLETMAMGEELCGGVMIADMDSLMMHHGTARSGWSDGMHPAPWITLQYMNLLAHVLADLGESCSQRSTSDRRQHRPHSRHGLMATR